MMNDEFSEKDMSLVEKAEWFTGGEGTKYAILAVAEQLKRIADALESHSHEPASDDAGSWEDYQATLKQHQEKLDAQQPDPPSPLDSF